MLKEQCRFLRENPVAQEVREVAGWILGVNEPIELKHLKFLHAYQESAHS